MHAQIADSGLLNTQIVHTAIWISLWKLYFSSAAAAWLGSHRALHCALAWRRIACAIFGHLTCRRRGRLVTNRQLGWHHSWRRGGWCRRRLRCLIELISFADAPPAGLVRTKPRCTLQAHDVAIEVAQHFGKIVVKSVFCEVWFCSDCRRYIMNEVAVEDHYFGSLKTDNLAARLSTRHHERPKGAIGPKLSRAYHVVFKNVGTKFNFCVGSPAEFSARFRRKNLDGLH